MVTTLVLVLAGVVISIVIGTFWYMPNTPTGKVHMRYLGFDKLSPEECPHQPHLSLFVSITLASPKAYSHQASSAPNCYSTHSKWVACSSDPARMQTYSAHRTSADLRHGCVQSVHFGLVFLYQSDNEWCYVVRKRHRAHGESSLWGHCVYTYRHNNSWRWNDCRFW